MFSNIFFLFFCTLEADSILKHYVFPVKKNPLVTIPTDWPLLSVTVQSQSFLNPYFST